MVVKSVSSKTELKTLTKILVAKIELEKAIFCTKHLVRKSNF